MRNRAIYLWAFVTSLASLTLVSCSDSGDDQGNTKADASKADSSTKPDSSSSDNKCDAVTAGSLAGTWAVLARYELDLIGQKGGAAGMCPQKQSKPASLLLALDVKTGADANSYEFSALACNLELPSVSAMAGDCKPEGDSTLKVNITIPEALTNAWSAIGPANGTLKVAANALTFDMASFQWGARSSNGLPTWQSDKDGCGVTSSPLLGSTTVCEANCVSACDQLRDDDKDNYPAVTVHLCGTTKNDISSGVKCNPTEPNNPGVTMQGAARMAVSTKVTLKGTAASSCQASGTFASDTQYTVVGSNTFLSGIQIGTASVQKSLPLFSGVESKSKWNMKRVDGQHGSTNWNLPQEAAERCRIVRSKINELH